MRNKREIIGNQPKNARSIVLRCRLQDAVCHTTVAATVAESSRQLVLAVVHIEKQ